MTARPGNWSLITGDGKDPVDGDPDAVRKQASYYSDMANTISKEASRLKTLGQDGELVGKYKKSLQEELGDLSDEVGKAHQRYEGVGTALKPYASALDNAKVESWGALQDAVKAHAAQGTASGLPNPQATDGKPLTDAQKTDQKNRSKAITDANDALGRAKKRLEDALTDLNKAGKKAAGDINDQSNDSLKDHHHWWDVVVKVLKVIVEILNYVVIVLAIVALFIPGLDVIVLAISLAILAADTLLAATGNGSWIDVALDLVGVLTFGAGKGLAKAGERAGKTAVEDATKAAIKTEFKNSGNIFMRNMFGRGAKMAKAVTAGTSKVEEFTSAFDKTFKVTAKEMARSGGIERLAKSSKLVDSLGTKFGGSSVFRNIGMAGLRFTGKTVWAAGVFAPLGNVASSKSNLPGLEDVKPYSSSWEHAKEKISYHTPLSASEYNWNDHPAMKSAVSNTVFGPFGPLVAGLHG
jgi:hypothetical protein